MWFTGGSLKQRSHEFIIDSTGQGLVEFTGDVLAWVRSMEVRDGLLTLHVMHTSASLLVQENADPEVRADLERFLRRLVPEGDPLFQQPSLFEFRKKATDVLLTQLLAQH